MKSLKPILAKDFVRADGTVDFKGIRKELRRTKRALWWGFLRCRFAIWRAGWQARLHMLVKGDRRGH